VLASGLRCPLVNVEPLLSPRIQFTAIVVAAALLLVGSEQLRARPQPFAAAEQPGGKMRARFRVPSADELRDSAYRVSALRGRAILLATRDSLPRNVGNSLRCASCHLNEGLQANAMPWVGAYARFPQYRARSGKVDLIEDRINDCFLRSMNGRALNPVGRDMRDIVSYFAFLSNGLPVGADMEGQGLPRLQAMPGDPARGAVVFSSTCVRCHGANGQGTALAPPLWGPKSYNVGAGMARIITAASFIHALMPIDRAQRLTPQQAFDVASYINTRPRPNFPPKAHDWPHGGKPPDADYRVLPALLPPKSALNPRRAQ
jgi:thiosulfate dehydrogenase